MRQYSSEVRWLNWLNSMGSKIRTQGGDGARIDPKAAILEISSNELTILAIRSDGSIADVIGVDSVPSPEQLTSVASQYTDCGLRLVPRSRMSECELQELVRSTVGLLQWGERNEPKPGANLLRDEDLGL